MMTETTLSFGSSRRRNTSRRIPATLTCLLILKGKMLMMTIEEIAMGLVKSWCRLQIPGQTLVTTVHLGPRKSGSG
eukprot:scaffold3061_cov73-Cyclotella_meneghiniana.AAC.3